MGEDLKQLTTQAKKFAEEFSRLKGYPSDGMIIKFLNKNATLVNLEP